MQSRRDVRPKQVRTLIEAGFLPVSIDYRLCPEMTLLEGPMHDVSDALKWARLELPDLQLKQGDIRPDGDKVVVVGWSTGGHLAMSLAWTSVPKGIAPPQAILSFYCPTDYEDDFWNRPNYPDGADSESLDYDWDPADGVKTQPITAYNPPSASRAVGGWMTTKDSRSRIVLYMNWKGKTLPVLINGLTSKGENADTKRRTLAPTVQQIQSISPMAQIREATYKTPTFLIHGTRDDLIPWRQVQRTHEAYSGWRSSFRY